MLLLASTRYAARARFLEGLDALVLVGSKKEDLWRDGKDGGGVHRTRGPGAGVRVGRQG